MIISPDRIRHWSILYATAPLPRGPRVRLRERWLTRLQERLLDNCDVIFIRHPKTGGTWFRVLLTHLYHQRYGVSLKRVFKADELWRQDRRLPRFLVTNGRASWERIIAGAFDAGDPRLEDRKVIFMARHPGDVAVSWHRQYRKRTKAFKRELLEAEMNDPMDFRQLERFDFVQRPELGLPALIDYHNYWYRTLAGRDNALVIRYEDLLDDTVGTLRHVMDFLGESFTDDELRAAAEFGSAGNLSRLEHSGYFHNSSLRLRDANDPDTYKVRRARAGGYRDDLTAEQAAWVERQIDTQLDPGLGYASRD